MKLAIFGSTGATGQHLVNQALQAGHHVTVLIRSPDNWSIEHQRLHIIVGTFDHQSAVRQVIQGSDAVISVLGVRKGGTSTICTDGIRSILSAMQNAGVRRLITLSAYGASETRDASWFIRFVRKIIADKMRDKDNMEALVRSSATDWTLVRPPALTNGKATGTYRSGTAIKPGLTGRLSRADLAAFILQEVTHGAYIGKAPVVSI